MLGCFFGHHEGVYGIFGFNGYRVTCYKCDKTLDEGIEFEVCPVCEGKGKYRDELRDSKGDWSDEAVKCFECNGTGFKE